MVKKKKSKDLVNNYHKDVKRWMPKGFGKYSNPSALSPGQKQKFQKLANKITQKQTDALIEKFASLSKKLESEGWIPLNSVAPKLFEREDQRLTLYMDGTTKIERK